MKNFALKFILTAVLGWGFAFAAEAQTLRGGVKDAKGEPVIGASVVVEGIATLGVTSDVDGRFELQLPDAKNNVLLVSFVGMKSQRIPVGGKTHIEIVMEDDATALEDVVVIGYGTVKRRDLTGSVASVTGDKLAMNPVSNIAQALQGQLPGVQVTAQDGRPGASMAIRVRGGNSITQSNDPLFIVDGVQVSSIDDIPADNIESLDVLKDAASTAIYGARGANGVILITTKGGKREEKTTVRYNMYYQVKENPKQLEMMDAYDYVLWNWSYGTAYNKAALGDGIAKYFGVGAANGNHLNEYKNVAAHNYANDLMRTAGSWNHDLSVSGGTEKTQLYAAMNYLDDEGIRINSGFRRWNVNFKVTQKLAKSLTFNADLRYADLKIDGTKYDVTTSARSYRPIDNPLGDISEFASFGNGSPSVEEKGSNPVEIVKNYTNIQTTQRIRATGGLTWQPVKGLTAKSELSLSRHWSETQYWDGGYEAGFNTAKLTKKNGYGVRWATTVNYQVQGLGENHDLSILVGNEVLASRNNESVITGAGYPSEFTMGQAFGQLSMTDSSLGKDAFNNKFGIPNRTLSWFGRLNYSYKGKYLFTATFRADGSSKFAPNNRWGYFPAAAAAWRISEEKFLAGTKDWLDNLKLRLSFGTSGSDGIDSSLWKGTWTAGTITVDGVPTPVYNPGTMKPNPDLKWETTTSRNIGVDFSFWNGRLRGSVDGYWNSTKDILMKVPTDASSGYEYQYQNVGETSNKGFEIALGADLVRKKDFNLSLNFTYSYVKNMVEDVDERVNADVHTGWGSSMRKPQYDYIIRKGMPVGYVQGFISNGYYTVDDFNYADGVWTLKSGVADTKDIVNYAGGSNFTLPDGQTAFPGMVKFKDVTGDGVVNADDVAPIAAMQAKHTGGFTLNGNWKNLDFSAAFTYQIGGNIYNANAMHAMMGDKDNGLGRNRMAVAAECFRIYDVDAQGDLYAVTTPDELAALNRNAKYALPYCEYGLVNSCFIEDASYLRLQTLTVGYTLPSTWLKKIHIQKIRVYFTGANLFCLAGYSGLDPDVNTGSSGINGFPTPNYDFNSYPKARTYTFGLNVTF